MKRRALAVGLLWFAHAFGAVEEDWQKIVALDAGPGAKWKTREETRLGTLAFLDRQEKTLRTFVRSYPSDPHGVEAQLRLAHLLATRADLLGSPKPRAEAVQLLDRLSKSAPAEQQADVEFAKISLLMMRGAQPIDDPSRKTLLNKALAFEKAFPGDRRLAPLLAEIARLLDAQPDRKKEMLERALAQTTDEELRQRIDDDLKRIALLGQPLPLKFTAFRGEAIDTEKLRGKVVLIYFFADWSPPSIALLNSVRDLAAGFPAGQVQAIGISLDETRASLEGTLKAHKIPWPIAFDGRGWQSPLARSLGLNALPTLWILDRAGRLRTLNAHEEAPALIAQLLAE